MLLQISALLVGLPLSINASGQAAPTVPEPRPDSATTGQSRISNQQSPASQGAESSSSESLGSIQQVGKGKNTTVREAIRAAGSNGTVVIPADFAGDDKFSNPNGTPIIDLRRGPLAYRDTVSVMDFGARCDGKSDDADAFAAADAYLYRDGKGSGGVITVPTGKSCAILHGTASLPLPADDGKFNPGDTCGGGACATLTPEDAHTMNVGFVLHINNVLSCVGTPPKSGVIAGPWDGLYVPAYTGVRERDQAALDDPRALIPVQVQGGFGSAIHGCDFRNALVAIAGPPIYSGLGVSQFTNIWFQKDGIAMLVNFLDSVDMDHVVFESMTRAGIVSGGWYASRRPGYDGGYSQKVTIRNIRVQGIANSLDPVANAIDAFFDNYFWKSRNTPGCNFDTKDLSTSTCRHPGVDPATAKYSGRMVDTSSLNPAQVYRGIAGSWINFINRNSNYVNNNVTIDGLYSLGGLAGMCNCLMEACSKIT